MESLTTRKGNELSEVIVQICDAVAETRDSHNEARLRQLLDKWEAEEFTIAFCGHFSAGKSSLINALCGYPLLPSSPIPTSANVVSIRGGEPGAAVTAREAAGKERVSTIPLDQLEAYCKNGEDIEAVAIHYPVPFLGDHAVLLDTPGIDSTDEAHMRSTESALHLADVIFYVMDYNHVQSEMNFAFTKRMKEWGKPLYLIINQIDKHKEVELPFDAYARSVRQSFADWHIRPDGILYVSVKFPEHPRSEWNKLTDVIDRLIGQSDSVRLYSAQATVTRIIDDHGKFLAEQSEAEKAAYRTVLSDIDNLEQLKELYEKTGREMEQVTQISAQLANQLRQEANVIIENANIIPASTRDLAHHYLQSRKPGFKAGFFAGAKATEKEIAKRLSAFFEDVREKVAVELEGHLQQLCKKAAETYGETGADIDGALEAIRVGLTTDWLAQQVHPGAGFSGEYTLNYARHVASEIKSDIRRKIYAFIDLLADKVGQSSQKQYEQLEQKRLELHEQLDALWKIEQMEERERRAIADLKSRIGRFEAVPEAVAVAAEEAEIGARPTGVVNPGSEAVKSGSGEAGIQTSGGVRKDTDGTAARRADISAADRSAAAGASGRRALADEIGSRHAGKLARTVERLTQACSLIEPIPAMKSIAASIRQKARRLEQNSYTVALFGAFSAGKSSLANALIGERILPVSPNPTTAAINQIMPPTDEWPHGSVKVRMKSADAVLRDVQYSLNTLGLPWIGMEQAVRTIGELSPADIPPSGKPHYTFLKAVAGGWKDAEASLGTDVKVRMDEFDAYVAEESKSCLVERVELYYDCPLTRAGVTLVDTPGADSINARHTGVAFNYIKNADAVLFVTYYNHAFSQADREFLLQLGRVKDSFELDKMFFLVNAADLAADEAELSGVIQHVEANLLQYGVRFPKIYPVSSVRAVEGKLADDSVLLEQSGMIEFERQFFRFTFEDLTEIAVHSAERELQRAAAVFQEWLSQTTQDERQRAEQISALRSAYDRAVTAIGQTDSDSFYSELNKEIRDLLYYVKQRSSFRFGELYQYAFNPAALREGGTGLRQLLQSAFHELVRLVSFDLSQEVLATTLRIEKVIHRLAEKQAEQWKAIVCREVPSYDIESYAPERMNTPPVQESLEGLQPDEKMLLGHYKNGKHFFEGEGKNNLRRELETIVQAAVGGYLQQHEALLQHEYERQFAQLLERQKSYVLQVLQEHVDGLLDVLRMKVDVGMLRDKQAALQQLVDR